PETLALLPVKVVLGNDAPEHSVTLVVFLVLAGQEVQRLDVATVVVDGPLVQSARRGRMSQELPRVLGLNGQRPEDHRELGAERVLPAPRYFPGVDEHGDRESGSVAKKWAGPDPQVVLHELAAPVTQADVNEPLAVVLVPGQGRDPRASRVLIQ